MRNQHSGSQTEPETDEEPIELEEQSHIFCGVIHVIQGVILVYWLHILVTTFLTFFLIPRVIIMARNGDAVGAGQMIVLAIVTGIEGSIAYSMYLGICTEEKKYLAYGILWNVLCALASPIFIENPTLPIIIKVIFVFILYRCYQYFEAKEALKEQIAANTIANSLPQQPACNCRSPIAPPQTLSGLQISAHPHPQGSIGSSGTTLISPSVPSVSASAPPQIAQGISYPVQPVVGAQPYFGRAPFAPEYGPDNQDHTEAPPPAYEELQHQRY